MVTSGRVAAWRAMKRTVVSKQLWPETIGVRRKSNRNEDLPRPRKAHWKTDCGK